MNFHAATAVVFYIVFKKMKPTAYITGDRAIQVLRISIALFMMAHGITRLSINGPVDFGAFLSSKGFPLGVPLAWSITILEIMCGLLLIAGKWQRLAASFFILELLMGIILVHFKNGWFVVGLTEGGIEYSVLLIICFLLVFLTAAGQRESQG